WSGYTGSCKWSSSGTRPSAVPNPPASCAAGLDHRQLQRPAGLPVILLADHLAVEGVALDRDAARFFDQAADLRDAQLLRGVAAGVVVDLLVHHRAVEVVGPEAQRHLGGLDAEHHP